MFAQRFLQATEETVEVAVTEVEGVEEEATEGVDTEVVEGSMYVNTSTF